MNPRVGIEVFTLTSQGPAMHFSEVLGMVCQPGIQATVWCERDGWKVLLHGVIDYGHWHDSIMGPFPNRPTAIMAALKRLDEICDMYDIEK